MARSIRYRVNLTQMRYRIKALKRARQFESALELYKEYRKLGGKTPFRKL